MYSNNFIASLSHIANNHTLTSQLTNCRDGYVSVLNRYYATHPLTEEEQAKLQAICREEGLTPSIPDGTGQELPVSLHDLHSLPIKLLVHEYKIPRLDIPHLRKIYHKGAVHE